jgi:acetyl esterase/lipase
VFDKSLPFGALPPIWMSVGGFEVFQDDCMNFARELESHEVDLTLEFAPTAPHIFPMMWPLFAQDSLPALERCAKFCVEKWSQSELRASTVYTETHRSSQMKRDMSSTNVAELFQHFFPTKHE